MWPFKKKQEKPAPKEYVPVLGDVELFQQDFTIYYEDGTTSSGQIMEEDLQYEYGFSSFNGLTKGKSNLDTLRTRVCRKANTTEMQLLYKSDSPTYVSMLKVKRIFFEVPEQHEVLSQVIIGYKVKNE